MPAACIGLFAERGKAAAVTSPADSRGGPSGPSTTPAPLWRDPATPAGITSAMTTGFSATAVHPQEGASLIGPHRQPLCEPREGRRALDELGVARHRPAAREADRVLHPDAQVAASR